MDELLKERSERAKSSASRMANIKGKKESPPVASSGEEGKKTASLDDKITELLIDVVMEQANQGERNGNNLTKPGWRAAREKFRTISGLNCDDLQIKSKWDALKNNWSTWYQIFGKEIGLGWNNEKNNFEASDDWWHKKISEDGRAAKFQNKGLKFAEKLTSLFALGTTTGEYSWAPSSGVLPEGVENLDSTEGVGDSEDPDVGGRNGVSLQDGIGVNGSTSAGASFGLGNFTMYTSEGSSLSERKRKMDGSKVPKGGKQAQQRKLNNYLDRLCGAIESHTLSTHDGRKDELSDPYAIVNVMKEVKKLPGMDPGSRLLAQCSHILKDPVTRQMFVALEDEESKLNYLLYEISLAKN